MALDHTHDASRRSWVSSANDGLTDFPIQNLPLGVFSTPDGGPRCGVAIGDHVVDLACAAERGLIRAPAAEVVKAENLDALLALGRGPMRGLRHDVFALLDATGGKERHDLLHPMAECQMHLPTSIRSFSDFFVGIYHAIKGGELTGNPDNPLPANYHYLPIGYNGRASTVRPSGDAVRRPLGLRRRLGEAEVAFGPSGWLDFELELGFFIGPGNAIGNPIAISDAADQVAGVCLLNDWSARDIQLFEMVPLGPLNSKSVTTSISPWIVTADALEPFRTPAMERLAGAPPLPAYLDDAADQRSGGIDIDLFAAISTEKMRAAGEGPARIVTTNARYLYWTLAQIIAHQSVNGCFLTPGDLIGSGTVSGPDQASLASLFELSAAGEISIDLPNGERRSFLEDGDEIVLTGRSEREGFASIGFGNCAGQIAPAPSL